MVLSVQDLLALPVMQPARPEVVVGGDLDAREVRWIHTSEIYEIAALLQGGEVLLTTGLGLVGVSPEGRREYVRALAARGVAAVALELGRTFPRVPREVREAAEEYGLPLVVLHGVVPFIEVTELVHRLILDAELVQLRRSEKVRAVLDTALAAGADVREIVATVGELSRGVVGLYSLDGSLLTGEDVCGVDGPVCGVEVGAPAWGELRIGADTDVLWGGVGGPVGDDVSRMLAELCAGAVAVCLAQASGSRRSPVRARAELLRDVATGRYHSGSRIVERARALGFVVAPETRVVGLVVEMTRFASVGSGVDATQEAARRVLGSAVVAEVDGEVLAAAAIRPDDLRGRLAAFADAIDGELRTTVGGGVRRLTAGPLVRDVGELARSLPSARDAAQLARSLGLGSRVVLASDLGVYQLLSSVVADQELERFIEEQLGPLLEEDARQGSDLMNTLDAYLEAGLSKTAAAGALGVRRQTLYSRLERISRLLAGLDLADRQRRTALDLALVSWRLRSSAVVPRGSALG